MSLSYENKLEYNFSLVVTNILSVLLILTGSGHCLEAQALETIVKFLFPYNWLLQEKFYELNILKMFYYEVQYKTPKANMLITN